MEAFDPMDRSEDEDTMPQQHVAVTTSIFRRSKPAAAPTPAEDSEDEDTMPWDRPLLREQARAPRLTLHQVGRIESGGAAGIAAHGAAVVGAGPPPTLGDFVGMLQEALPAALAAQSPAAADATATPETAEGASSSFEDYGGHVSALLEFCAMHCHRWEGTQNAFVGDMAVCGYCARVGFGGRHSRHRKNMRKKADEDVPPGVLANPHLLDLCTAEDSLPVPKYWACGTCAGSAARRKKQADYMQASVMDPTKPAEDSTTAWLELLGMLLSLPAGSALQLSVLQCSVRFTQRLRTYVHALEVAHNPSLMEGPLVTWVGAEVGC
jgi:hypothetical protein